MREYSFAITGATGLVGSHLVDHLVSSGYVVHVFGGDINSRLDVDSFILESQADFFVHLAGSTDTKMAYKRPAAVFETNVLGTLNVLDALHNHGLAKSIVIASSDRASFDPLSPYGASKLSMESVAMSYRSIGLPVSVIRFCNIYGPRDYSLHRFIPKIMHSNAYGMQIELSNNGNDARRYIHVVDAVRAILLTLQVSPESIVEIRSDKEESNLSIVNKISTLLGHEVTYKLADGEPKKELVQADSNNVGWYQTVDIDRGLADTVMWYKKMYKELDSY